MLVVAPAHIGQGHAGLVDPPHAESTRERFQFARTEPLVESSVYWKGGELSLATIIPLPFGTQFKLSLKPRHALGGCAPGFFFVG